MKNLICIANGCDRELKIKYPLDYLKGKIKKVELQCKRCGKIKKYYVVPQFHLTEVKE
jgi:hypothetical protein